MCEDNERAYKRMINSDLSSNDDWNIHVIEQNTPSSIILFSCFIFLHLNSYINMYINVILS